jgi:predicted FMN-binding regulatory protein PaiB
MMHYREYDAAPEAVDAFIRGCELGRLLTVSAESVPQIGLFPFLYDGAAVELHLNRADAQLADLLARPRCVFELDEVLAVIPSYWVHAENGVFATAYHRTVALECEASVSDDGSALASQQQRLLGRYQPEGGFRGVTQEDPMYRGMLAQLCSVRLAICERKVKFKLGQNRPAQVRARIVEELRKRGRPGDARAADALQWTIDREAKPPA